MVENNVATAATSGMTAEQTKKSKAEVRQNGTESHPAAVVCPSCLVPLENVLERTFSDTKDRYEGKMRAAEIMRERSMREKKR